MMLRPKHFCVENNFWFETNLGPNKFWVQKNLDSKNFGSTKFSGKKIFGPKRCSSKFGKNRLVFTEIFHYTETGTNVAGTNVPWSNVPKTFADKS